MFLIDKTIYGEENSYGWHLTNMLLNTLNVILMVMLATELFMDKKIGFISGLIFAVYPVHVEAVAWMKNRSELLCGIFYFLCLLLFINYLKKENKLLIPLIFISMFLSMLAKEMAITLPIVMLIISLLLIQEKIQRRKGIVISIISLLIVSLWYISKEYWWRKEMFAQTNIVLDAYLQARIVTYTLNKYLTLLFFPLRLNAEHKFDLTVLEKPGFYFGLIIFVLLGLFFIYRKDRNAIFCWLWTIVLLLPVSNIVFLEARPIAEQRLYIISAGMSFLAGQVFVSLPKRISEVILVVILTIFALTTFKYNFVWKNSLTFWQDVVKKNPDHFRANYNLGVEYQKRKDYLSAIKYYEVAAKDCDRPEVFYSLGYCYDQIGDYDRSLEYYQRCLKLVDKPFADLYNNMGIVFWKKGQKKKAEELFQAALKIDPEYTPAKKNLEELWKK
jgi:tetratricopeptide (TPR) repeat protein